MKAEFRRLWCEHGAGCFAISAAFPQRRPGCPPDSRRDAGATWIVRRLVLPIGFI